MAQGAFGSNVGGSKRLLPFPASKPLDVKMPHVSAGPAAKKIRVSTLHLTQSEMGTTKSSQPSGSISGFAKVAPAGAAGSGSSGTGGIIGGVEGFIGHLSSDVVHTAMGFPVGIMYLINHPIAGAEGMAKATWADWSPLFHGNVDQWAHNFYQHPLAPILDVAGVLTLGAGTAGRVAAAASKLGDVAEEGSVAAKLADFANPAIRSTELNRIAAGSRTSAGLDKDLFRSLQEQSTAQYRIVKGPAGDVMHKAYSSNPLVRLREQQQAKLGNAAADASPLLKRVVGDQALYKRWSFLDKGRRAVAVQNQIQREVAAIAKGGAYSDSLAVSDKVRMVFPGIYETADKNARTIRVPKGSAAPDAKLLQEHGIAFLSDGQDFNRVEKVRNAFGSAKRRTLDDVARVADLEEAAGVKTHDQILMSAFRKAGQVITTTKAEHAAMKTVGNFDEYRVVSNTLAHKMGLEGAQSDMVMRALWREPVKVWRHLLLGLSPRYFVNNFIGNTLMLMAAINPVSLYQGYKAYVRVAHGARAEAEMERQTITHQVTVAKQMPRSAGAWNNKASQVRKAQANADREAATMDVRQAAQGGNTSLTGKDMGSGLHPLNQHMTGAYQGMSRDTVKDLAGGKGWGSRFVNNRFNLYGFTHKYTDSLHRGMAMMSTVRRFPEYQAYKADALAKGLSAERAEYYALKETLKNGAIRHSVVSQVEHMLGNYHTFTNLERGIKNNLVPFYAWDKALVAHVRHIVSSEPYKAAMGVAIGNQGGKVRDDMLGQVPDFMASMIPGALLGGFISDHKGRKGAMNALSMSPYSTIADMVGVAGALTGHGNHGVGETVGATLNPMLTGIAAQLGGVDLQTGAPVKPDSNGPIAGLVKDVFGQLPQIKLFGDMIGSTDTTNTTKAGNPTLYEHGFTPDITSFLGVPIRQISQQAAQAEVDKQKHKKKRHLPTSFPGL